MCNASSGHTRKLRFLVFFFWKACFNILKLPITSPSQLEWLFQQRRGSFLAANFMRGIFCFRFSCWWKMAKWKTKGSHPQGKIRLTIREWEAVERGKNHFWINEVKMENETRSWRAEEGGSWEGSKQVYLTESYRVPRPCRCDQCHRKETLN